MHTLKSYTASLVAFVLVAVAGAAFGQQPVADKDYKLITPPQKPADPKKIEVLEFFSYACPHCAEFEPSLQDWLKRKPKDVDFRSVPMVFREQWKPLAKLYYTLEAMGEVERLHMKVFHAIHKENQQLFDDAAVVKWATSQGLDAKKFGEIYNSFGMDAKVQRAAAMGKAYGVMFTPSLAVNGKYYTGPSMTTSGGGVDYLRFLQVLDQLIGMERGKPAAAPSPPNKKKS
jgi:thiol:disulfide interchange protein DsbA